MNKREFTRFEKTIRISDRSIRFYRTPCYKPVNGSISKRGEIKGFSRHSALRLRDALSMAKIQGLSKVYGICLTLPWKIKTRTRLFDREVPTNDFYNCLDDYKAAFNRFGVSFRRRFVNSAAIFRHELQTRKIPHCHLVVYFSSLDVDFSMPNFESALKNEVCQMWFNSFKFDLKGGSAEGFLKRGVDVQFLEDQLAMFRYLADHSSKHKQAQLGYKGKQWGYLNRQLLVADDVVYTTFSSRSQLLYFSRSIRRFSRFSISSDVLKHKMINCRGADWVKKNFVFRSPFRSKKSKTCSLRSVNFIDKKSSSRLVQWIQRNIE